jgi:cytosine/adenosine deaminase-related metal-dependent hydrolase
MTTIIHADGLVRGDEDDLLDGAVVLDEAHRVLDVGPAAEVLPRHAGAPITRVHGVVAPFLVNAHTHVELSALRGKVPGGHGFVPWVDKLVTSRPFLTEEDESEGISTAVEQLSAAATSAVGEVTNGLTAARALANAGMSVVLFHEMFGVLEEPATKAARDLLETAKKWRADIAAEPALRRVRHTPSPHTLYTTHASAVRILCDAARDAGARITIHLAEHPAERSAIELGSGPSVAWMQSRLRIPEAALSFPRRPLFDVAAELGVLRDNTLLVHLTDARPQELARVRDSGAFPVLCPRSNLYIETRLPPLLSMLELGLEPALGTDSLASNTSLDVLAEARALRDRFSGVPASRLLRMATWNGARALDFQSLGRIARGASPGVFAVSGDLAGGTPSSFLLSHVSAARERLAPPNP